MATVPAKPSAALLDVNSNELPVVSTVINPLPDKWLLKATLALFLTAKVLVESME